jgi:methyl-accepting chemotaxis protein/methyl-accepting chemotaxis protein-1 (serine sensor receptor)
MSIDKKVLLLAGTLLFFMLLIGVLALHTFGTVEANMRSMTSQTLPQVEATGAISSLLWRYRGDAWKHMATKDPAKKDPIATEMLGLQRDYEQQAKIYEAAIQTADDRKNFEQLRQNTAQYFAACADVVTLSRQGGDAIGKYLADADPVHHVVMKNLAAMEQSSQDYVKASSAAAEAQLASSRIWLWVGIIVSTVLGSLIAFAIIRSLKSALQRAVTDLSSSAQQVALAAGQIASASQWLAQGASEQAAALQQTSASSEEITAMSRRNVENSESAAQLVQSSEHQFVAANESLDQMVVAMDEIGQSSDKISKIIKIIDEIAFQTNILALNAAVEAARAGEAGMGFAVVADEVRNLAQRCAQAARDTTLLIQESMEKSSGGKAKVDQVATVIHSITEESGKIKRLVDEVTTGSREQARGAEQIGQAITEMEQVTQKSAATAQENASAGEELTAQSAQLQQIVAQLETLISG